LPKDTLGRRLKLQNSGHDLVTSLSSLQAFLKLVSDVAMLVVPQDTYAYSLAEIKSILSALAEPACTIVLTAALTGLRKGEIRGLKWADFDGKELAIKRSVWNSTITSPRRNAAARPSL
jgi:integrase